MHTKNRRFNISGLVFGVALLLSLAACASTEGGNGQTSSQPTPTSRSSSALTPQVTNGGGGGKTLIAYFSKTGNTETVARQIQELTGGDLFMIEPATPYPDNYQETTEVARDELDQNARPEVKAVVDSFDDYDTIILGYPIWWGQAPMPVLTFLESYDMSGKTIAPFATAVTSEIDDSLDTVHRSAPGATFLTGQRLSSDDEIEVWLREVGILQS